MILPDDVLPTPCLRCGHDHDPTHGACASAPCPIDCRKCNSQPITLY